MNENQGSAGKPGSAEPTGGVAGRFAITSVAQLGAAAAGGLFALVIGRSFGTSAETDGLFAAYSAYTVMMMIAQSLRLSMVPRLVRGDGDAGARTAVGALVSIAVVAALLLVVLRDPVATVITHASSGPAHDVAEQALFPLWLAACAQLVAGYGAAVLASRNAFTLVALSYLVGSFTPVVLLLLWPSPSIDTVAQAVAIGGAVTCLPIVIAAGMAHPPAGVPGGVIASFRLAGHMLAGALGSVMWQVALVASLSFAGGMSAGSVTIYTYAFFAAGLVNAATSGSLTMVMAGPLTSGWDGRDPRDLEPGMQAVVRACVLVIAPVLGIAVIAADDVAGLALGSALDGHQLDVLRNAFLALAGVMIGSCISPVPALAGYATGRFWAIAAMSLIGLMVHIVLCFAVSGTESLVLLAAVASVSSLLIGGLNVLLIWGRAAGALLRRTTLDVAAMVGVAAAAFVLPALAAAATDSGLAGALGGAAVGMLLYLALARRVLPEHVALLTDAVPFLRARRLAALESA